MEDANQQKSQYNWLRTLTIGFGIASIGISIAIGGYILVTKNSKKQVACTEELKICPDGTNVARKGPNCEFSSCP